MDQNPKQQIAEKLRNASNVLIAVPKDPSVDQLSAAIGLTLMLNELGKHATTVFNGEIPSILEFLEPEKSIDKTVDGLRDFIISLDKEKADKLRYKVEDEVVKIFITPYKTRISEKDLQFTQGDFNVDVVVALGVHKKEELDDAITSHGRILHDATVVSLNVGGGSGIGSIEWIDENASCICEMLVSISEALEGGILEASMSTAFLTGIVASTDRFSNTNTTPKLMTMAAQLMAAGANQQLIASNLNMAEEQERAKQRNQKRKREEERKRNESNETKVDHSKGQEQKSNKSQSNDALSIDHSGQPKKSKSQQKKSKKKKKPSVPEIGVSAEEQLANLEKSLEEINQDRYKKDLGRLPKKKQIAELPKDVADEIQDSFTNSNDDYARGVTDEGDVGPISKEENASLRMDELERELQEVAEEQANPKQPEVRDVKTQSSDGSEEKLEAADNTVQRIDHSEDTKTDKTTDLDSLIKHKDRKPLNSGEQGENASRNDSGSRLGTFNATATEALNAEEEAKESSFNEEGSSAKVDAPESGDTQPEQTKLEKEKHDLMDQLESARKAVETAMNQSSATENPGGLPATGLDQTPAPLAMAAPIAPLPPDLVNRSLPPTMPPAPSPIGPPSPMPATAPMPVGQSALPPMQGPVPAAPPPMPMAQPPFPQIPTVNQNQDQLPPAPQPMPPNTPQPLPPPPQPMQQAPAPNAGTFPLPSPATGPPPPPPA